MLNMLAAAALVAASPQPSANVDPAMYIVRDHDTTIYLFGTFHALDGKSDWFNSQVKTAFDQSGELVLETLIPEGPVHFSSPPAMAVTPTASFLATTRQYTSSHQMTRGSPGPAR